MNHAHPNRLADPETLLVCPYDPIHMVRVLRWARHMNKCRKNHPNKEMATCTFNAKHVVPSVEMPYHLTMCPDQVVVHDKILADMQQAAGEVRGGDTSMPDVTDWARIGHSIDWSEEYRFCSVQVDVKDSITDRSGLTRAQRREHRKLLKQLAEAQKAGQPTDEIRAAIKALSRWGISEGNYVAENGTAERGETRSAPTPRMPHELPKVDHNINYKQMNGVSKLGQNDTAKKNRLAANFNLDTTSRRFSIGRGSVSISPCQNADMYKRVQTLTKLAAGRGAGFRPLSVASVNTT